MNTKTDGISSGLVAVAWIAPDGDRFRVRICEERPTDAPLWSPMCWISDAEAIINDLQTLVIAENQRKQQLEEDRDTWKARAEFSYAQRDNQSAALKLARDSLTDWLTTGLDEQQCYEALAAIDAAMQEDKKP